MSALQTDTTILLHEGETIDAEFTTQVIDVQQVEGFSFQLRWSGVGFNAVTTVEGSNDLANIKTFNTVHRSSVLLTQDDGSHIYDACNFHYRYMRLKITVNSGTADFDIFLNSRSRRT